MAAVDAAIHLAKDYAAGRPLPANAREITRLALKAAEECPPTMIGAAATSAGFAAVAALTADAGGETVKLLPARALKAFVMLGDYTEAARADYRRLLNMSLGVFPDPGLPVDCSDDGDLGPLWPSGIVPS
jgi:hypothetical protein